MTMYISLFAANYAGEFRERFEATAFPKLCLDEGNCKTILKFRGTSTYGTVYRLGKGDGRKCSTNTAHSLSRKHMCKNLTRYVRVTIFSVETQH